MGRAAENAQVEVEHTLNASIKDGVSHALMLGVGESNLGAYGIFLNSSASVVGLLATLPPLVGAIAQAVVVNFGESIRSRRAVIASSALGQALLWIPIAALAWIPLSTDTMGVALVVAVMLYHALAGVGSPLWNSLIGDVVPSDSRGRYFGKRGRLCGIATMCGLLGGGWLMAWAEGHHAQVVGFTVLFFIAALARLNSARWLAKHSEPPHIVKQEHHFSLLQFLLRAPRSNFAKFVLFVSAVNFSVAVSGPYFAVYMFRTLKLSFFEFSLITAMAMVTQLFTFDHWGSLVDRFGTKRILNVCALGVSISPLLWLAADSTVEILLIQAYAGAVWAGFNLAASNFMFDAVTPPKRARCVAYQALVNNSLVCLGSLLGGAIAGIEFSPLPAMSWLPDPHSPLLFLFVLSGALRLLSALLFLPLFREVRDVESIRHRELLFRIVHLRPLTGATFALIGAVTRSVRRKGPGRGSADRVYQASELGDCGNTR